MITFDHLKLIHGNLSEMKRLRTFLLGLQPADVHFDFNVEHEHDGRCCREEAWNITLIRIYTALKPPARMIAIDVRNPVDQ